MHPEAHYFEARQRALRDRLRARKLAALVVTHPANIFYLTGFQGSAGAVLFGQSEAVLFVDPRYTLQARGQVHGVNVIEVKNGLLRGVARRLQKRRRLGFEDAHLTYAEFQALRRESPASTGWAPAGELLESLRVVKDDLEIGRIRKACRLTAEAFEEVALELGPGVSELDLASELEFRMRRKGAEGVAFELIVASGPRGALPHARPSGKLLRPGELVIFDLGAILSGYRADMTRTVFLGAPDRRVRSLYQAVLNAQEAAIGCLRAGVMANQVDAAARRSLAKRQLDKFFTHSTGHGVGIEIHERPRLGKNERKRILAASVVTVEPAVYLEGFGGIRIEDTVLVGKDGPEILTPAAKESWFVS